MSNSWFNKSIPSLEKRVSKSSFESLCSDMTFLSDSELNEISLGIREVLADQFLLALIIKELKSKSGVH